MWRQRRQVAVEFLWRMWDPDAGYHNIGSGDGTNVDVFPVTADAQTLPQLVLRDPYRAAGLDWVAGELAVTDESSSPNTTMGPGQAFTGVTFSNYSSLADPSVPIEPGLPLPDPDAVWFEGTARLACALLDRAAPGDLAAAMRHLNTLAAAQRTLGWGQSVGDVPIAPASGIVAASSPLHSGVDDTGYYRAQHVAATSWFVLAALSANPFRPVAAGSAARGYR